MTAPKTNLLNAASDDDINNNLSCSVQCLLPRLVCRWMSAARRSCTRQPCDAWKICETRRLCPPTRSDDSAHYPPLQRWHLLNEQLKLKSLYFKHDSAAVQVNYMRTGFVAGLVRFLFVEIIHKRNDVMCHIYNDNNDKINFFQNIPFTSHRISLLNSDMSHNAIIHRQSLNDEKLNTKR